MSVRKLRLKMLVEKFLDVVIVQLTERSDLTAYLEPYLHQGVMQLPESICKEIYNRPDQHYLGLHTV